ncbi:hypothetical protein [Novosphingobium fuchskuhlense]|uniref:hypothetical protein n=1 Tax=Novosphingobium fuchskuhlense TaxID=1117702 RepID=UPI0012E34CFE|nr:hypothetical protein [Novosphingobium fuchskuhlense]
MKTASERPTFSGWAENVRGARAMIGIEAIAVAMSGTPHTCLSPPRFHGGSVIVTY